MKSVNPASQYQMLVSVIKDMEAGTVFVSDDMVFSDKSVLRVYLSRLVEEGEVIRLGSGVFCKPRQSDFLKTIVIPDIDEIASAIARAEKARIFPVGEYSLYKLGLSTQVPAIAVYGTDGSARVIRLLDGRTIRFKSVAARNFAYRSSVMQTVVSAMREIGERNITDVQIASIAGICSKVAEEDFRNDLRLAPEWIQKRLLKEVRHHSKRFFPESAN